MDAKQKLTDIAEFAIEEAKREGADFSTVLGFHLAKMTNRFRQGEIHQPDGKDVMEMQLVLWRNGRQMTSDVYPNHDQVRRAVAHMLTVMKQEGFPESDLLPPEGPYTGGYDETLAAQAFDQETAALDAHGATERIAQVKEALAEHDLIIDGNLTQKVETMLLATSHGTLQAHTSTQTGFAVYGFDRAEANEPGRERLISAFSWTGGHALSDIDTPRLIGEVITKCRLQRGRKKINPFEKFPHSTGELFFDVIVETPFIGALLTWLLGYGGFNGKFYLQGESFTSGKMGRRIFGENITVVDDPFNPRGLITPFDLEGVPKRKLVLAERGILKNVVYDTTLAVKANAKSTGHAIPASQALSWGAFPENVLVEGGSSSIEDMIAASKNPTIWITKVHYLGMKHFQTGTLTGTAQHGVFLVENGEVVGPVENLRFDQAIPEALCRVTHLGEPQLVGAVLGSESGYVVPPMRIERFRFVGATPRTT